MKWGLICPICNRLLWTKVGKFQQGEMLLMGGGVAHGQTGKPAKTGEPLYWCGCKPSVPPKQQDLAEPR